jgi:hypothetical protein
VGILVTVSIVVELIWIIESNYVCKEYVCCKTSCYMDTNIYILSKHKPINFTLYFLTSF